MNWLGWLYAAALMLMAVYGFNMLLLAALALRAGRRPWACPADNPALASARPLPSVLVQLPIYNERYVVERLIDAVAALDYPADRLTIQVLDDSTDNTTSLACARAAYHRGRGRRISVLHRTRRSGFKAGALSAGLAACPADLVAVFDADFVPNPDFLRQTTPLFAADARLAMVQTRWAHLNAGQNALTRAEALALDGYFCVEQVARSQSGLMMNFNGSGGIWRSAAILDAGGWQGDTLAEDLDLSYRAQLAGWRLHYLPGVTAPAELPTTILAFKRQQFRWAKGSFQVLRKLGPRLLAARMPLFRKLQAFLHLTGYLPHSLMVLVLALSLPVVLLLNGRTPLQWGVLGLASFGPLLLAILGQASLRSDWPRHILAYPMLVFIGIGLALTNLQAAWEAAIGQPSEFLRTPKQPAGRVAGSYSLPNEWTIWGETFLSVYALVTAGLALEFAPGLAPFIFLYALGFGFTAALGFWQSEHPPQTKARAARQPR